MSLCLYGLGASGEALAAPSEEPSAPSRESAELEVTPPSPGAFPEPPKGRKLFGWGTFGVVFGVFNIGYGIPLSIEGPGDAYFSGIIPISFGVAFTVLGALGVHFGKHRKRAWAAWHDDPTAPPLVRERRRVAAHVPWLIVGGVTAPVGAATVGLMIPTLTDPVLNTPAFAYYVTGWGAASFVAGVTMFTVGAVQGRRSRQGRRAALDLDLTPTSWANAQGFGVGLAGRF